MKLADLDELTPSAPQSDAATTNATSYAVTISDEYFISLDGVELAQVPFQANRSYVFRQEAASNSGQIVFSNSFYGSKTYYTTNYSIVGTLGRPGAYTQITLPSNFTGSLFYFLKSLTREFTYSVKTQPYYAERKYAMSSVSGGAIHYKQIDISFTAPNRYYFDVQDSTDLSYQLVFGTIPDTSNNPSLKITRGRSPGSTNAFVLLDLSGYVGSTLYYFDASFARMGSYPAIDASLTFVVTVSNNDFYLDGTKNKFLNFNRNAGRWKFDLSSSTNTNNQLYFSSDPYSIVSYYSTRINNYSMHNYCTLTNNSMLRNVG
jgi:hypothetical protein